MHWLWLLPAFVAGWTWRQMMAEARLQIQQDRLHEQAKAASNLAVPETEDTF